MINEVMEIEKEAHIEQFKSANAMKNDAVTKILKKLKETAEDEN